MKLACVMVVDNVEFYWMMSNHIGVCEVMLDGIK